MEKKAAAIVVGCGSRGNTYASHEELWVVACVDTNAGALRAFRLKHDVAQDLCFSAWEDALREETLQRIESTHNVRLRRAAVQSPAQRSESNSSIQSDWRQIVVIVATPDRVHAGPAIAAANLKLHVLLEKPMAVTEDECEAIVDACESNNIVCAVGHVLRHVPSNQKMKEMIEAGEIGDVLSIRHIEPVGWWHFAHSFVRGNWKDNASSTFLLMSKCCHDLDLIAWWMGAADVSRRGSQLGNPETPNKCVSVASMGNLMQFTPDRKPKEAEGSKRCYECPMVSKCIYSAKEIYINELWKSGVRSWPLDVVVNDGELTIEKLEKNLREGPYGRCVYGECGNDVVDHQQVIMEFASGATANLSVVSSTERFCSRSTEIYGTKGQLTSDNTDEIRHFDFKTQLGRTFDLRGQEWATGGLKGHSGGDGHLVGVFLNAVRSEEPNAVLTTPRASLVSHRLVFAAERARRSRQIVQL